MSIRFVVNDIGREFEGDGEMPLLWYLRDHARLTGTKFGCGVGSAAPARYTSTARPCAPAGACRGRRGALGHDDRGPADGALHPVQQAWLEEDVPQCGYCQAGQIMATVALLRRKPEPGPPTSSHHQSVPLRDLCAHPARDRARAAREMRRMNALQLPLSRRTLLQTSLTRRAVSAVSRIRAGRRGGRCPAGTAESNRYQLAYRPDNRVSLARAARRSGRV